MSDRLLRGNGSAASYWVAYCFVCEAAYAQDQEATTASDNDDEAAPKLEVVSHADSVAQC